MARAGVGEVWENGEEALGAAQYALARNLLPANAPECARFAIAGVEEAHEPFWPFRALRCALCVGRPPNMICNTRHAPVPVGEKTRSF